MAVQIKRHKFNNFFMIFLFKTRKKNVFCGEKCVFPPTKPTHTMYDVCALNFYFLIAFHGAAAKVERKA